MTGPSPDSIRGRPAFSTQEQFRDRPAQGQQAPGATTDTDLYTCPKGRMASGSVFWCDRGAAAYTVRVAKRVGGVAIANKHYIMYDVAYAASQAGSVGPFELAADDVITVRASTANISFNFDGVDRPRDTT